MRKATTEVGSSKPRDVGEKSVAAAILSIVPEAPSKEPAAQLYYSALVENLK